MNTKIKLGPRNLLKANLFAGVICRVTTHNINIEICFYNFPVVIRFVRSFIDDTIIIGVTRQLSRAREVPVLSSLKSYTLATSPKSMEKIIVADYNSAFFVHMIIDFNCLTSRLTFRVIK